jgi:hypothetical protein
MGASPPWRTSRYRQGDEAEAEIEPHHLGPAMRARLPALGWAQPVDPAIDHGNWTRIWPSSGWDPASVARLVVRNFDEVYGLYPWGLAVSLACE